MKAQLFLLLFLLAGLPAKAAELRSLTLGLVSPNLSTQLPIVVGQQAGFFKEEGLSVHGVTIASGGTLMVAILTSGHADLVVSGVAPIMRAIDRGAPVSVVAGFQNKIDFALIGSKRVARLEDLRGKIIGVTSAGSFSEFAVLEAMKRRGFMRDKDYQLIAAGSTHLRIGALKGGKVDAIPLSSGERHTLEDEGYPVLMEVGQVVPEIPLGAGRGQTIRRQRAGIRRPLYPRASEINRLDQTGPGKSHPVRHRRKTQRKPGRPAPRPQLFCPGSRRRDRTRKHRRVVDGIGYQGRAR